MIVEFVGVAPFVVKICAYIYAFVSSCSCNRLEVQQQQSNSSHGGGNRMTFVAPICDCGEFVVLRTATIVKNCGRQFWGCPKYKVRCIKLWFMKKNALILIFWLSFCLIQSRSSVSMGCNFFRWCKCIEDKDGTIVRQRNEICSLEKRLKMSRKWIKMLLVGLCVVVVINIAMLIIFLKFP